MYTITCDGKTLHNPSLGEGYVVLGAALDLEIDKAGTLTFSIAPTNVCYADLAPYKNRLRVYKNGACIWEGRTLDIENTYDLFLRVTCEGRIAELNDCMFTTRYINVSASDRATATPIQGETITRADGNLPAVYQKIFERFNRFIGDTGKNMILGSMDIPWPRYMNGANAQSAVNLYTTDPEKTFLDLLFNGEENEDNESTTGPGFYNFPAITGTPYNAHIIPRYRGAEPLIVDIIEELPTATASQKIEFGKNLLDITQFIDPEGAYSIIYPFFTWRLSPDTFYYLDGTMAPAYHPTGSTDENDVSLSGKIIENQSFINLIGRVIKPVHLYVDTLDEATGASYQQAREQAATEALAAALDGMVTISIKAIDLTLLGVNVDEIELYKYYEIVSAPHEFDEIYQCVGVSLDIDEPQNDVYTFGVARQTLTNWITEALREANK